MKKIELYNEIVNTGLHIDKDVYDYGMVILKHYLIYAVFSFCICGYLKCIGELIIFYAAFTMLRRYLGGFHFNNSHYCTLFTILITSGLAYLSTIIHISVQWYIFIFSISIGLTALIGCVEHKNKRISLIEKRVYKQRALLTEVLFLVIGILLYVASLSNVLNTLALAIIFCDTNVIVVKVIQYFKESVGN